jgi:sugar-specific transcriptional regulator TrmB
MNIAEQLHDAGLTPGEARTYTALLELGSSTVGRIAKRGGVARSKIYEVLERLEKKGLVTHIIRSKTRVYTVGTPTRIIDHLQQEKRRVETQLQQAQALLPALYTLSGKNTTPEAELFTGMNGLRSAHEKLVEHVKGKEICFFYNADAGIDAEVGRFFTRLDKEYRSRGIRLRGIVPKKYKNSPHLTRSSIYALKFVDFPIPNNIAILEGKTLLSAWKNRVGVLITSPDIAHSFRDYFEELWKKAST